MTDLKELPAPALKAAMRGGTEAWGEWGSARNHVRYAGPNRPQSRQRCHCGCKRRATHIGMANGVGLIWACELRVARWVRDGH